MWPETLVCSQLPPPPSCWVGQLQDVLPLMDVFLIHVILGEHLLLDVPTLSSSVCFLLVLCNLRDFVDSHPLTNAANLAAGRGPIRLNFSLLTSFLVPEYVTNECGCG